MISVYTIYTFRRKKRFLDKRRFYFFTRGLYNDGIALNGKAKRERRGEEERLEIYIEYALMENFLLDITLLYLSLKAAKRKIRYKRLCFAGVIGAVFAVAYPFLVLPPILSSALKIAVGLLLCLIAFGRIKDKKDGGRYALNAVYFFLFSFCFGGAILAIFPISKDTAIGKIAPAYVFSAFIALAVIALALLKKLYRRYAVERYVYPCIVRRLGKEVKAFGFYDSGNFAEHKSLPVCFLSPDLAFDVFGGELFAAGEIEIAETKIMTMSGEKTLRLFKGEIEIKTREKTVKKQAYFALSSNMLSRGYKLILHSRIFEIQE